MTAVARLVTFVDIHDREVDARTMSMSARQEAELADGRRLLILDGRGWTSGLMIVSRNDGTANEEVPDIWAVTTVEEIEDSARTVVGPDEPYDGYTREEIEAGHWAHLSDVLRQQGITADADELKQLPHDVVLSERLLARLRP